MTRAIAVVILCLLSTSPAHAISCHFVRSAVAKYGLAAAESWARSHGYSERQIEEARKCIK